MGGSQIDLRQATIPGGDAATLDVLAVMSGCDVVVPGDWIVSTPAVVVMGGIEDKRLPLIQDTGAGRIAAPRLIITGFIIMGGITIKS
jgi:hypothetical protein